MGVSKQVFVFVDPSAGSIGIHNAGFVQQLLHFASTDAAKSCVLVLASHKETPTNLQNNLKQVGVLSLPMFDLHGYALRNKDPASKDTSTYISVLRDNLVSLFKHVTDTFPNKEITLVYPSMSWEHLLSLSSAIEKYSDTRLQHRAFMMYWNGVASDGTCIDSSLKFIYRQLLQKMQTTPNITLYSSSLAYQQTLNELVPDIKKVQLHSFFLDDWCLPKSPSKKFSVDSTKRILAYSGEIADLKGFNKLPEFIPKLLERFPTTSDIVVHGSNLPPTSCQQTFITLQKMAKDDSRIKLIGKFLSANQIRNMVSSCDLIALNYDPNYYRHKTSGYVWLAARLGKACIVPANTWLAEESASLGMNVFDIQLNQISKAKPSAYADDILQPFWPWLENLNQKHD